MNIYCSKGTAIVTSYHNHIDVSVVSIGVGTRMRGVGRKPPSLFYSKNKHDIGIENWGKWIIGVGGWWMEGLCVCLFVACLAPTCQYVSDVNVYYMYKRDLFHTFITRMWRERSTQ